MSEEMAAWARSITQGLTAQEKLVLVNLATRYNRRTGRCDPAMETIAAEGLVTERAAYRIVGRLEAKGFLGIRSGGKGPGDRNSYTFPQARVGPKQGTLWPANGGAKDAPTDTSKGDPTVTLRAGAKDDPTVTKRMTPHVSIKRSLKGITYGGLSAAAAYRQAAEDLPRNGNVQDAVGVLVNFAAVHLPEANVPGRLGLLVNLYPAADVLDAIWHSIPKQRPLDYAQAMLKRRAERAGGRDPPAGVYTDADFQEGISRSRQGRPRGEGE